jgi:hypothetical protein
MKISREVGCSRNDGIGRRADIGSPVKMEWLLHPEIEAAAIAASGVRRTQKSTIRVGTAFAGRRADGVAADWERSAGLRIPAAS